MSRIAFQARSPGYALKSAYKPVVVIGLMMACISAETCSWKQKQFVFFVNTVVFVYRVSVLDPFVYCPLYALKRNINAAFDLLPPYWRHINVKYCPLCKSSFHCPRIIRASACDPLITGFRTLSNIFFRSIRGRRFPGKCCTKRK